MSKQFRKGEQDHLDLAKFMFDRACASNWVTEDYATYAWADQDTYEFWLEEAWETLVFIGERCLAIPTKKEPTKAPLGPEWKVPHLCSDGIHDWKHDDDLGITYCGKCDYWNPDS
jgi:hypothetical protein